MFLPFGCFAVDDLTASMRTSASGMKVQNQRLKVIAQNIANSDTTGTTPNSVPYRRKILMIKNTYDPILKTNVVKLDKIIKDKSQFNVRYKPTHPAADRNGYVLYPNVNIAVESVDAKEADRTLDANLNALEIAKNNQMKLIEMLK